METHGEHIQALDLDIDVHLPQGRTASAQPISINTDKLKDATTTTATAAAPPQRTKPQRQRMTTSSSDGGSFVGRAAYIALDTRVILGALLGWSLVSKVLKRWNNTNNEIKHASTTGGEFSSTPHASMLETEVKSLRKSLQDLRVDNLVLAAQVAELHGGMASSRSHRSAAAAAGKALNDAFEAAAASARAPKTVLVEPPSSFSPPPPPPPQIQTQRRGVDDAEEMVMLQKENEELRLALEQLRLENAEMAERMLEVALTGAGASAPSEPVEVSDLNQLGELRNALISEAGGVLEAEEDALWLELASDNKTGTDQSDNSVLGGPTTPEVAHEGGEASGTQGWQRHIPAAAYLED